jgi:four helix bundle protein
MQYKAVKFIGLNRDKIPNMATVTDFKDFEAFKACRALTREIGLLVRTRKFAPNRRLVDQMERASISVLSNFAEGFEREGNSEFVQFLSISKGSIGELRAQLIYAIDLGLLSDSQYDALETTAESATRLLGGLMRYLSGSVKRGRKYDRKQKRRRSTRRRQNP